MDPLSCVPSSASSQWSDEPCPFDVDDLIQYHNNSSNGNDWCQSCVLLFSDCICSAGTPAGSYDYSSWSSTLAIQTSNHTSNVYQQLHSNPNYNTTSLCIPSQTWASTALASRESSAAIGNRSEGSKVKRGRVKGTLSIEEARVKRLEQNRRSQRDFRSRQVRIMQDLRQKVEVLTEENEKLRTKLLGVGMILPVT